MVYRVRKKNRTIKGHIQLNGSKSISNRVLIIEALSGKEITKKNLSDSNDTRVLQELLHSPGNTFNAQDAGTSFRFLTAFLSLKEGEWTLTGSDRMKQRPIADLVEPLRRLGAEIDYTEHENFPPLKIRGGKVKGGTVQVHSGISSQFASALLMIAPRLKEGLKLELTGDIVSEPYINMTLSLMNFFGINYEWRNNSVQVPHQSYSARDIFVESDWSAASYYYEMAAFADELELTISGLLENSLQGDSTISQLMKSFGVRTEYKGESIILSKGKAKNNFHFDLKNQPDLAPALIVTCAGLSQPAIFTGLSHLQYKESHRGDALASELAKCRIEVKQSNQSITISGQFNPDKYTFSTYLDHRMAMALTPLSMLCEEVIIEDPMVVRKSYPGFWEDMRSLGLLID